MSFYSAYKIINEFINNNEIPKILFFKIADFLKDMKIPSGIAYKKIEKNGMISTPIRNEMDKVLTFQIHTPKFTEVLLKDKYDKNDYETHNIFSKTWTDDGKCFFEVNEKVFKEYFINLENGDFITTPLKLVSQIKNDYNVRFYEYFKSYVWNRDFVYKKRWDLRELKLLLGLNQISKTYINKAGALKERILDPVQKEINEITDLNMNYEFIKGAKNKVTHILFEVKLKNKQELNKQIDHDVLSLASGLSLEKTNIKTKEEIEKIIADIVNS